MATLSSILSTYYGNNETGGLWLPDPTLCFTDTGGTTPAGDGDLVARINDATPNGRNAIQATAANQMRLVQRVDGRWYFDPEDRDVFYAISQWAVSTSWTVGHSYTVNTVTAQPAYAFGRSTTSGGWQFFSAAFASTPSRSYIRAGSQSSAQATFVNTTANSAIADGNLVASGFSSDRTTWANVVPRLYHAEGETFYTLDIDSDGTPDYENTDVAVLFRASSAYTRRPSYGVFLRGATTTQNDLDTLLEFLTNPEVTTTSLGVRITDIKEPNESDQLVTSVANATVYVWTDGTDDGAPTWTFANQSITAGALEDIELAGIDPEESSVVVTVHWDAGGGETKFFRYVPSVIDLDA